MPEGLEDHQVLGRPVDGQREVSYVGVQPPRGEPLDIRAVRPHPEHRRLDVPVAHPEEDQVLAAGVEPGVVVLVYAVDAALRQPAHPAAVRTGGVQHGRAGRGVDPVEGPDNPAEDDAPAARRPAGLRTPAQGFVQLTGTMCAPRPLLPTISSTLRPLGRSRSNRTREPSGETAASISNCFGPGWVRTRRPLPSGWAETSRAVENLSSRTCVHTIRPACARPCDPRVAACAGTATVSAVRIAAATSAASRCS